VVLNLELCNFVALVMKFGQRPLVEKKITRYESDMEIVYLKSTVFELNEVKYIVMSKSNRLLNGLDKLNHTQSTRNK
jgi:hypothetical protein